MELANTGVDVREGREPDGKGVGEGRKEVTESDMVLQGRPSLLSLFILSGCECV